MCPRLVIHIVHVTNGHGFPVAKVNKFQVHVPVQLSSEGLLAVVQWSAAVPFAAVPTEQGGVGTLGTPEREVEAAVHTGIPVACLSLAALCPLAPGQAEFD